MNLKSIITSTDSYKFGHWQMNSPEYSYAYYESRVGAKFPTTKIFGLQPLLQELENGITQQDIDEARLISALHFGQATLQDLQPYKIGGLLTDYNFDGYFLDKDIKEMFNIKMWQYILMAYQGKLPIRIKCVPEGMDVPVSNIIMDVENTDDRCAALTTGLESFLTHVWYPSTVATQSAHCKKMFKKFLDQTSENPAAIDFMLHDFGYRGVSSNESAAIGGLAHLVNFKGTDTIPAMLAAINFYAASPEGIAYSVPASEHSVMTKYGREGEAKVVEELLNQFPTGILSVVGDSYDIYNFVESIVGVHFKQRILTRQGVFVIRPDSITPTHKTPAEQVLWILESLWKNFSGTTNSKGFRVLNPHVRVLWGDGLTMEDIESIVAYAVQNRFSAENMVFGMGGGLLQKINRDTQRFAFKSSAQCRNGVWYEVYKEPKDASKASKKGRLKLVKNDMSEMITVPESDPRENILQVVFENGKIVKSYTFDEVRKNATL